MTQEMAEKTLRQAARDALAKADGDFKVASRALRRFVSGKPHMIAALVAIALRDEVGRACHEATGSCRPGHIHNRAHRYMEKEYLKDLWVAWRKVTK